MKDNQILDNFEFEEPDFPWDANDAEVVGKYFSLTEAEIAAARLRSEGLPCFVANATSQAVLPHLPGVLRLHVRPVDAELAREILAEAVIDADLADAKSPEEKEAANGVLTVFAVAISLILAGLLARAVSGRF